MLKIMALGACSLALLFSGCATVSVYPTYKGPVKVSISTKPPSGLTDLPATGVVFKNNQVVATDNNITEPGWRHIRDGERAFNLDNPTLFFMYPSETAWELLGSPSHGVLFAKEIFRKPQETPKYKNTFDSDLEDAFRKNASQQPYNSKYKFYITRSEILEDVSLCPSAWFSIDSWGFDEITEAHRPRVILSFAVKATFKDESGAKRFKWYRSIAGIRSLSESKSGSGGWFDDDATIFNNAAKSQFDRLSQIILKDIAGEFGIVDNKTLPPIQWKVLEGVTTSGGLLYEQADYILATDRMNGINVIDRSFVVSGPSR